MPVTAKLFTNADHQRIKQAIQEAESKTSAEIVPVVARSSGRYDRPEDIVGLWFVVIGMIIVWAAYPLPESNLGSWSSSAPVWQLIVMVAVVVAGFVLGAFTASKVDWLCRLFTPREEMRNEVLSRARAVFFDNRVHHTAGGSGVLLYVSLFEHMAAIITDQSVLEKLGQEKIEKLCGEFTERLHAGTPTEALCETAKSLGEHLAGPLPRAEDDVNELADVLVVID